MAATVAEEMPSPAAIAACEWLPDRELAFYAGEYARTGFQGGLQWYRCGTTEQFIADMETFSGRTIDVPSCFISGRQDWGIYQRPGAIEAMQASACTDMRAVHLIEQAGHWVQQEQPDDVSRLLLAFIQGASGAR
jgi:pimeloyl-ACP methyl ester carboxylesterase